MMNKRGRTKLTFPGGQRFAFSVFDDTDVATLDYITPLYDYLHELGIYTTKSVWGLDYQGKSDFQGTDTLENPEYSGYIKLLKERGFEIGFHGATMESAFRGDIVKSLKRFHDVLGEYPKICAAHASNQDNLYWGDHRFAFKLTRWLYRLLNNDKPGYYQGHIEDSPYFWGDIAKQHLEHVRSFTFTTPNLLDLNLPLVYRNHATPWVNNWYLSCNAENVESFNALISGENQQKLEDEGGLCIMSTHFGKGFIDNGDVHPTTKRLLKELSERDCWFAPVTDILHFYAEKIGCFEISKRELFHLELGWFLDSVKRRRMRKNYNVTEAEYLERNIRKRLAKPSADRS